MAVTFATPTRRTVDRPSVWVLLSYAALSTLVFGRSRSDRSRGHERGAAKAEIASTRREDDGPQLKGERADERGRGRRAEKPWQIPWAGWKDILWRSYQEVADDRLLAVAAGVVFYGLLAVFPAI